MSDEKNKITFKELVQARKEEMRSMRPGLMTKVSDGEHIVEIYSPTTFDRSTFKVEDK